MDHDLPYSDVLIHEERWTNFVSEVLLVDQRSEVINFNSATTENSYTNPIELDDILEGFGPTMVHNHDNSDNNNILDWVNLPVHDFNNCMDQVELWTKRAKMAYKERESALEYSISNQDFLLQQLRQRDEVIERLQNEIEQEKVRRSQQVSQLEREICEMEKCVKGYGEMLKDVNNKFEEYRARVQHHVAHSDDTMWFW